MNYDAAISNLTFRDLWEDSGKPTEAVSFKDAPLLTHKVLTDVFEYCNFAYKNHPPKIQKPIKQSSIYDITSPYYANFANKFEGDALCEMILAANFLNNDGLL